MIVQPCFPTWLPRLPRIFPNLIHPHCRAFQGYSNHTHRLQMRNLQAQGPQPTVFNKTLEILKIHQIKVFQDKLYFQVEESKEKNKLFIFPFL